MTVVAPEPRGTMLARQDAHNSEDPWFRSSRERSVSMGGVTFRSLGAKSFIYKADAVVVPLAGTIADTVHALWGPGSKRRVAVWGHVGNYVADSIRVDVLVERMMMKRADHVFAYTASGTALAVRAGIPSHLTTTLNNTIDTSSLRECRANTDLASARRVWDSDVDPTAKRFFGFIGALDETKRIEFLSQVLDHLWKLDPGLRVLVGGRGEQEYLLSKSVERGQTILLGRVGATEKASMAAICEALLNPGRIGLVAVDALTLGLPLITTNDYAYHAPEKEYLEDGVDVFFGPADPRAHAEYLLESQFPPSRGVAPELDAMVTAFATGVLRMLA